MRKVAITLLAASVLCPLSAQAADMGAHSAADLGAGSLKDAPFIPAWSWTGFYIGGHVGGAFAADDDLRTDVTGLGSDDVDSAFIGGGQIGANYQFWPRWVVGVEADISAVTSGGDRTFVDGTSALDDERGDWIASVTGRLGYTWGDAMIYVKGGVAFRDESDIDLSGSPAGVDVDRDDTGWTVGGGLEAKIASCWSAKVEYQFYDFGTTDISTVGFATGTGLSFDDDIHTLKVGLNYYFY
jgi:outer membrane immunogenic protein